jgi:hypothetical protein
MPAFGDSARASDHLTLSLRFPLQRLFSMFPNGWPGRGLLLLRLVAGIFLMHDGLGELLGSPQWGGIIRQSLATGGGILLLLGLWTPMAGVLVVIVELWAAFSKTDSLRSCVVWPPSAPLWRCSVLGFGPLMRGFSDESGSIFGNTRVVQSPLERGTSNRQLRDPKENLQ